MTLTELAKMHKPAILIPSPNVADNHQYKNAKVLADAGAALMLEEQDLNEESIVAAVKTITEDAGKASAMSEMISAHAVPDVERRIYEEMCRLLKEGSRRKKRK
jgi:UDP-N-acetylglucosamine--N-acetylmuramyl-(pentapeptide) pyrophosphoryl-undecaprenol N-acetylglucosamine transferase